MKYFKKIVGERVYLSPINPDDAETYCKWLNDLEVTRWLGNPARTITLLSERKFLEGMTGQDYAIVLADGDELLGNISLMNIHQLNRSAGLGIFIGEASRRSCGYGSEAIKLLLNYSFKTLNLHNIMLQALASNERALACYRKCGFTEFGRRHQDHFHDGFYDDTVYMEVLSDA